MAVKKNNDPFWWTLFGAGGTLAAFFVPVCVLLTGIAWPLGWISLPDFESLLKLIGHPVARIFIFTVVSLSLFHCAHRFRYTLYDGLQLKHLEQYIKVICYGSAFTGTVIAAILVIRI